MANEVKRDQLGDYYGCPGKIKVAQIIMYLYFYKQFFP